MAISSVSTRLYDAPDPIMETDLDLLSKVNTYQQAKFDQGAANLQNEINNWALLADVAKPQDREYINSKLNNLVSGITNLGGVNLSDPNNVNSLKALGYNLYGDNNVMNAVVTTKKLRGFMADGQSKLNGKNAKDYDSTYYEYQLNKWNKWLQDGEVGTTFDGPSQLGSGSFEGYQKKINDAISKLPPDSEEAPTGNDALNYYQVGTKFIKKERINQLIEGLTTAQDRDIISAHAWKNLGSTPDDLLLKYTIDGYNSKIDGLKSDYNSLKHTYAQSNDFEQKQRLQDQMNQVNDAIKGIDTQKKSLFVDTNGKSLNDDQRDQLRSNLYFDAYKNEISTAWAFQQNKTELKFNQAKAFQLKEARQAYEFGETMNWRKAQFDLEVRKQDFAEKKALAELGLISGLTGDTSSLTGAGLMGPSSTAPLVVMENLGKTEATVMSQETVNNANSNYAAAASNFYNAAYNILGSLPEYQQYVIKQDNGIFMPKDDSAKKVFDQAILNKVKIFDTIPLLPLEDRKNFEKQLSQDDNLLFKQYKNLKEAELWKQQVNDIEEVAFRDAGMDQPSKKIMKIDFNDGTFVNISYQKLKQLQDEKNPILDSWKKKIVDKRFMGSELSGIASETNYLNTLLNRVNEYYDNAKSGWNEVSKNYSPFGKNISLQKDKNGKVNPVWAQYFGDAVRRAAEKNKEQGVKNNVTEADVDLNRIWIKYDANGKDSKLRYMAEVKYKKGTAKEGDKFYKVDITEDILNNPTNYIARLYDRDNAQIIYGLHLDKDGMTPLDEKDNYASALSTYDNLGLSHKYQIVARQNPNSTTIDKTFRVFMLIPKKDTSGKITYLKMPVINTTNTGPTAYDFPNNFNFVTDYMNIKFKDETKAKEFYQLNGIK